MEFRWRVSELGRSSPSLSRASPACAPGDLAQGARPCRAWEAVQASPTVEWVSQLRKSPTVGHSS